MWLRCFAASPRHSKRTPLLPPLLLDDDANAAPTEPSCPQVVTHLK
jgi:hypothetical protein